MVAVYGTVRLHRNRTVYHHLIHLPSGRIVRPFLTCREAHRLAGLLNAEMALVALAPTA
jgi:hypothetical protein